MEKKSGIVWLIFLSLANGVLFTLGIAFSFLAVIVNSAIIGLFICAVGGVFHLFKKSFYTTTFTVGLILLVLNIISALGRDNMGLL